MVLLVEANTTSFVYVVHYLQMTSFIAMRRQKAGSSWGSNSGVARSTLLKQPYWLVSAIMRLMKVKEANQ
jgi:hypothetical protein